MYNSFKDYIGVISVYFLTVLFKQFTIMSEKCQFSCTSTTYCFFLQMNETDRIKSSFVAAIFTIVIKILTATLAWVKLFILLLTLESSCSYLNYTLKYALKRNFIFVKCTFILKTFIILNISELNISSNTIKFS